MVVDLPRRWRWVIGAGCAVVVALAVLMVVSAAGANARAPSRPEAVVMHAAPAVAGTEATTAAPQPAVAAAEPPTPAADELELCGGAWVKVPNELADTPEKIALERAEFERATQLPQRRADVLESLRAAPGALVEAASRLVEVGDTNDAEATRSAHDALVQAALSGRDPKVYALAFKACRSGESREGGCSQISAAEWARLDPDNAAPWLFLLGQADTSPSRPLQDEALHRIATAPRVDLYSQAAAAAVIDAAPKDEASRLAVYQVVVDLLGREAAVGIPGYQVLRQACKGDALKDANRAQACDGVAEALTERSTGMLDLAIGLAIGKELGWPRDRTDRLRGEYDAFFAAEVQSFEASAPYTCSGIARQFDDLRRKARLGETGVFREWVANSGRRPEDFIRASRARAFAREAAASAAAASAAALLPSPR